MKAQLYNQTLSHRFGTELSALVREEHVRGLAFAVAWVRRSGIEQIRDAMTALLRRGGSIRGTVGVDVENTSAEGLDDLLALQADGDAKFWVYHDEEPRVIFHPKIYLLTAQSTATLIVGSNNLTRSGLFHNTEAGLQVEASLNDPIIQSANDMLASWRAEASSVVRVLTPTFRDKLVNAGYVLEELKLRERRRVSEGFVKKGVGRAPLFGRNPVLRSPPTPQRQSPSRIATARSRSLRVATPPQDAASAVLLMRVRRASESGRRTQIQIPIRLAKDGFFGGSPSVTSHSSGETRNLAPARSRGIINTIKMEVPEIATFTDPVMRLERGATGIVYRAFDASSAEGRQIMSALTAGRGAATNPTELTLPSAPSRSTWWRFV